MHYGSKEIKEEVLFKMFSKYWGYLMFMNKKDDKDSISTLFANNLNKKSKVIKKFNHIKAKSGRLTKM
jgi:predicted dinucleotide-binding enzyme